MKRDLSLICVNTNLITILYKCNRSAFLCLWNDMSNQKSVTSTTESTIRDKGDIMALTCSHNHGAGFQHFRHAGSTFWPFISYDNNRLLVTFESALLK